MMQLSKYLRAMASNNALESNGQVATGAFELLKPSSLPRNRERLAGTGGSKRAIKTTVIALLSKLSQALITTTTKRIGLVP